MIPFQGSTPLHPMPGPRRRTYYVAAVPHLSAVVAESGDPLPPTERRRVMSGERRWERGPDWGWKHAWV